MDAVLEQPTIKLCPCDDCGDIYDIKDLRNHFRAKFLVCKSCVELYKEIYN